MEKAWANYQENHDQDKFLESMGAFFQVKIHENCKPYLFDQPDLEGKLSLIPFTQSWKNYFTYEKLFADYGSDIFPALLIGSDGFGVEFWLDLETSVIISLHQDASFYEVAAEIQASNSTYFRRNFAKNNFLFKIDQLIHFQQLTNTISKDIKSSSMEFGYLWLNAALQALGKRSIDFRQLSTEFIYTRCANFIETEGWTRLKFINEKRKKLEKFATEKKLKSLNLSYCCLSRLPDSIFEGENLKSLNLSYNPELKFDNRLSQLHNLEELIIGPISAEDLNYIQHLPQLQTLVFHECPNIDQTEAYKNLVSRFPKVEFRQ